MKKKVIFLALMGLFSCGEKQVDKQEEMGTNLSLDYSDLPEFSPLSVTSDSIVNEWPSFDALDQRMGALKSVISLPDLKMLVAELIEKGFGFALSFAGIGVFLGAFLAPYGVSKVGRHHWIRLAMLTSAACPLILAATQTQVTLILTAFLVSFFGQNLKVTNDALVQSKIDDYYRGRVFAVYDVVVNGAIVSGGLIAALLLPTSGLGATVPLCVSAAYLLVGMRLLRASVFPPVK